jgi:hypothetical protein
MYHINLVLREVRKYLSHWHPSANNTHTSAVEITTFTMGYGEATAAPCAAAILASYPKLHSDAIGYRFSAKSLAPHKMLISCETDSANIQGTQVSDFQETLFDAQIMLTDAFLNFEVDKKGKLITFKGLASLLHENPNLPLGNIVNFLIHQASNSKLRVSPVTLSGPFDGDPNTITKAFAQMHPARCIDIHSAYTFESVKQPLPKEEDTKLKRPIIGFPPKTTLDLTASDDPTMKTNPSLR